MTTKKDDAPAVEAVEVAGLTDMEREADENAAEARAVNADLEYARKCYDNAVVAETRGYWAAVVRSLSRGNG